MRHLAHGTGFLLRARFVAGDGEYPLYYRESPAFAAFRGDLEFQVIYGR